MILVTGASGLVGEAVVRLLLASGAPVIATDVRAPGEPLPCPFILDDVRQQGALLGILQARRVRQVVHAGAISGSMVAPNDPMLVMTVNVAGSICVAEACRLAGVEKLIALSSIGVYGDQVGTDPVPEDAPKNGADIYSCSKIAMESVLFGYRRNFGLPVTVLRMSSIFGPGRRTPCFVRGLLEAAEQGHVARVSDDTHHRRQFLYIDDAARSVRLALEASAAQDFAYNITGGTWQTETEVGAIARQVVPGLRIQVGGVAPLGLDGRMGPLDIRRAADDLGYRPQISFAEGLGRFVAARRAAAV